MSRNIILLIAVDHFSQPEHLELRSYVVTHIDQNLNTLELYYAQCQYYLSFKRSLFLVSSPSSIFCTQICTQYMLKDLGDILSSVEPGIPRICLCLP